MWKGRAVRGLEAECKRFGLDVGRQREPKRDGKLFGTGTAFALSLLCCLCRAVVK